MNLAATMSLDSAGFSRGLGSAKSGLGGFLAGLGNLGNIVTGFANLGSALNAAIAPLREPLKLAADLESVTAEFEVMLGSGEAAGQMLENIQKFAASTPFEIAGLANNAKLLLSFGQSADSILPTLKMIGDVAGSSSERFGSLALAFAQISAGGKLTGQDLLQMINAGFNPLQEMARTTGESMASLRKRMEGGAISAEMVAGAFRSATSQGGRFFGNMEKQSGTWNGLMSTMRDGWAEVQREFGKPIMDAIKPMLTSGIGLLGQIVPMAQKAGAAVAQFGKTLFAAFQQGDLGSLLSASLKMGSIEAVNFLSRALTATLGSLGNLLGEAASILSDQMSDANFWKGVGERLTSVLLQAASLFQTSIANVLDTVPGAGNKAKAVRQFAAKDQLAGEAAGLRADYYFEEAGTKDAAAQLAKAVMESGNAFMQAFNNTANLLDPTEARTAVATLWANARAAIQDSIAEAPAGDDFIGPKLPGGGAGGLGGAMSQASGMLKPLTDRLTRMGAVVGGGGQGVGRPEESTARNTARSADLLRTATTHLAVIARNQPGEAGTF